MRRTPAPALAAPAGLMAASAATGALLAAMGTPAPEHLLGESLAGWVQRHGTAEVLMALMRLAGLALSAWVLVCSTVAVVAGLLRIRWLARAAGRVAPPGSRRLLGAVAGLGAHLSLATVPAAAVEATAEMAPVAVASQLQDAGPATSQVPELIRTTAVAEPAGAVVANLGRPDAPEQDHDPRPADPTQYWTVEPGEHLWHIATEALAAHHPAGSSAEIADYHRRLVELNRHELAVPENPDLLYPGQVLELPPVSDVLSPPT